MTVAVNDIISRVQTLIRDLTGVRWPQDELINWLNDGQREVILLQPKAGAKNTSMALVAGTKQSIPNDGTQLLRVMRNTGVGGATPGRAITEVDREVLDTFTPDWHSDAATAVAKHYIFDPVDPTTFYVYPPADGSAQIEVVYASSPTVVTAGQQISVPDIYANALMDYMLYRAYSKDSDSTANAERAQNAYNTFVQSLGLKVAADARSANASGTQIGA